MTQQVTIVGLGLIGGSIGKALRRRGWSVAYVDPAVPPEAARAAEAADEKRDSISENDNLVVIATPVDAALELLRSVGGHPALFTSVCSVMAPLRDASSNVQFIAGHPFAGSERSGLNAAEASLFEGKPWFVEREDNRIRTLITACRADPTVIEADEHDRILAITSHLPQVVATAMASLMADADPRFIGTGARTMLRLAGSSYDVWKPVLDANRQTVESAVRELYAIISTIKEDDFERAQKLYEKLKEM
jgi:prephenate dehydrogenase